jgi:tetratricopeptide (TPR) repeat protein
VCAAALVVGLLLTVAVRAAPIHDAVRAGDSGRIRVLLQGDPELVMLPDADGLTPLHIAIRAGNRDVSAVLLAASPITCYDQFLDVRTDAGKAAAAADELSAARDLLLALVRDTPDAASVNFAYGMVCASLGDYSFARLAFDRVIQANPSNARAHVALARTHLALGQVELATESFHRALACPMPESARRVVENYLGQISGLARARRFDVAGRFDVGYFRDDNVNVGPESRSIQIAPLNLFGVVFTELAAGEGLRPIADSGFFFAGMLTGAWDIGAKSGWDLTAEGHYYQNWLDDTPERENMFYQAVAGLRRRGPRSTLVLPLGIDRILIDGETFVERASVAPFWLYASGPAGNLRWLTRLRVDRRDYADSRPRDGTYLSVSEMVRRYIGEQRHSLFAAVACRYDATESDMFRNLGVGAELGGELKLPWRITAYLRGGYERSDYVGREPLAPEDRVDDLFDLAVGVNKRIGVGWSIDLSHRYLDNRSTFDLYEYRRNITTIGTAWSF